MIIKPKIEQISELDTELFKLKDLQSRIKAERDFNHSHTFPLNFLYIASPINPMGIDDPINSRITPINNCTNSSSYTYWSSTWNYFHMNYLNPCTKNLLPLDPVNDDYFIVEFPIEPGIHNTVWLLTGHSAWHSAAGWLLEAEENTLARYLGVDISDWDGSRGMGRTLFIGPDGRQSAVERYHYWLAFHIHKDDITQYATSNNTVRVAFKPIRGNSKAYIHISGIASTQNPAGSYWIKHLLFGSHGVNYSTYYQNGLNKMSNLGNSYNSYLQRIAANTTVSGIRIPILGSTDISKDKIIGAASYQANNDEGYKLFTLTGTDLVFECQIEPRGKLAKNIRDFGQIHLRRSIPESFVVPRDIVAQHAKIDPIWGYRYLEFDIRTVNAQTNYWYGLYSEDVIDFFDGCEV